MTDKQIESLTAQYGTPLYVFDLSLIHICKRRCISVHTKTADLRKRSAVSSFMPNVSGALRASGWTALRPAG